jgi:hypothetical protein
MTRRTLVAVVLFAVVLVPLASADSLEELSQDFWQWRAAEQPFTADDLVRIERPAGWVPDWSPKVVENYRRQLGTFEARWVKLRDRGAPIPRQVDYSLIGSAWHASVGSLISIGPGNDTQAFMLTRHWVRMST